MPFLLTTAGIIMVAVGVNGTHAQFFTQLKADAVPFTGYAVAVGGIGAMGYIRDLRELSHYLMALIIISLILSNRGVFQRFAADIKAGPLSPAKPATQTDMSGASLSPLAQTTQSAIKSNQSIALSAISPQSNGINLGTFADLAMFALA